MKHLLDRPRDVAVLIFSLVTFGGGSAALSGGLAGGVLAASSTAAALAVLAYLLAKILEAQRVTAVEARQLWGLSGLLGSTGRSYAPPGGAALGANALNYLARELAIRRPQLVVELGPGASSVILGRAAVGAEVSAAFIGVEHDARYLQWCRDMLRYHGCGQQIVHAPTEIVTLPGWTGEWYSLAVIDELPSGIDILVVDGPPNPPGADSRYPAFPALRSRLAPGALILVDDAHRPAERGMVKRWASEGPVHVLFDAGDFIALQYDPNVGASG